MTDFKMVPLKEIKPDPNQPRKFYDEAAMQELTDSVREKGILQPILIRPNGKGYIIVCGERRYKAALNVQKELVDHDVIPAVIRELSDEEALELQIIENLQRKDVHPMEEAVAFKSLIEKGKDLKELAARIGKSEFYARQRIKLNDLSKAWQDVFYKNKIKLSHALQIATLAEKEQEQLYKAKVNKKMLDQGNWIIEFWPSDLEQLKRKLNKAPFDIKDATLQPMMGACTNCKFNSAVAILFPEDAKDPICGNASCFAAKCAKAFDNELKKAIEDPDVILIYESTYQNHNSDLIEKLKKGGQQLYKTNEGCITKDNWRYKETKGLELLAFILNGTSAGHYTKVKLITKSKSSAAVEKKKAGAKLTATDITEEIRRINDREKRNQELDLNKIHEQILRSIDRKKTDAIKLKHQGSADRGIMVYLLLHEISSPGGWGTSSITVPGIKKKDGYGSRGYDFDYIKQLGKASDDQIASLCRQLILKKWGHAETHQETRREDTTLYMLAQYAGIDIKSIEKAQAEIADKRNERIKKRIADLNEQKKQLSNPKAKTAKS